MMRLFYFLQLCSWVGTKETTSSLNVKNANIAFYINFRKPKYLLPSVHLEAESSLLLKQLSQMQQTVESHQWGETAQTPDPGRAGQLLLSWLSRLPCSCGPTCSWNRFFHNPWENRHNSFIQLQQHLFIKKTCLVIIISIRLSWNWWDVLPGGNDGVLGSEAVNRAVLHAESNHSFTHAVLHQQVQSEVLHKVTGVVTKWLNRNGRTDEGDATRRFSYLELEAGI